MIGILTDEKNIEIVEEFFELFKTPWELYRKGRQYQIVIINNAPLKVINANLIVAFAPSQTEFDFGYFEKIHATGNGITLDSGEYQYPVYSDLFKFTPSKKAFVTISRTGEAAGISICRNGIKILIIGYNLFSDIKHILTIGQPKPFAHFPTLDIHISNLRNWILKSGLPLIEIPPISLNKNFFACLTHDVDFVGIRNHRLDHTILGFVYRATIGSLVLFLKGRTTLNKLIKNFMAVMALPLVQIGLLEDFWIQFSKFIEIEKDLFSTFFFVPFSGQPGISKNGMASKKRAVKYNVDELATEIRELIKNGFEIGVHGIDSWVDLDKGRKEFNKIKDLTGQTELGVRIHWLFYITSTPKLLEKSGYSYDSTFGYNETIGFRGGTLQPFRPFGAERLLEIPLHIQDTALFYKERMNLSEKEAFKLISNLIENAEIFGGVLTLNWHHRSMTPERLWGDFYIKVIRDLKNRNVKFLSAGSAARWFHSRRSVKFEKIEYDESKIKIRLQKSNVPFEPDMLLRLYKPSYNSGATFKRSSVLEFIDQRIESGPHFEFTLR